ncbi:hypothetical protein B0I32_1452 [Nonomuraea fuscirosea]|uniref:Uncharacterized protein n=1 Tax=Nonomuraea fuscirosea TaxID=1291556 RepID=A0A2T0LS03_9ACTN|nr:hypothetical protein B0I32_1452 [Nonomuraea fuscirosea]
MCSWTGAVDFLVARGHDEATVVNTTGDWRNSRSGVSDNGRLRDG